MASVANNLKKFSFEVDQLLKKNKFINLAVDDIDFLDIFIPLIVVQASPKYYSKYNWLYLIFSFFKNNLSLVWIFFKCIACSFLRNNRRYKNIILCNSSLSFREIFTPMIPLLNKYDYETLYTSMKLDQRNNIILFGLIKIKSIFFSCLFMFCLYCKASLSMMKILLFQKNDKRKTFFFIFYLIAIGFPYVFFSLILGFSLKRYKCKNVICCDVYDPNVRIINKILKNNGAFINMVQFGHIDLDSIEWKYSYADRLFLWGDKYKSLLVNEFGVRIDNIEVIGSSRFDYIFKLNEASHLKSKYILIFSTYTIKGYDGITKNEAVNELKQQIVNFLLSISAEVVIKPHPLESTDDLILWASYKSQNIRILEKHIDAREYIANADFVVSFGTGLTLDCLISQKLVLLPNWLNSFPWEYGMLIDAGAKEVRSYKEFVSIIEKKMSNANLELNSFNSVECYINQTKPVSEEILKVCS